MNLRKIKCMLFMAYVCLISSMFFGAANCSEDKLAVLDGEKFFHVKEVEVYPLYNSW